MSHDAMIEKLLSKMTLEEKIGQCLTVSWRGAMITPSVVEAITKLHVGGFRIEPFTLESATAGYYGGANKAVGYRKPKGYFTIAETYFRPLSPGFWISGEEYARRLNRLKDIAMNRRVGLPLHITTDYEGDYSHDYPYGGVRMFPANMGIRAAGGPKLAYKVGLAIGRQLSAVGINMVHSPVCDVNINPANPEINIRAFSDDPAVFTKYAVELMKGLEDGGLIATAKHFPGRGDSEMDAHADLPVLRASRERIERVELAPYRALVKAGLRAVMSAHNAYAALDGAETPATISKNILTGILREQLGFDGVITTDAMGMGAIVQRWGVPVASAMALKAGASLVLLKFDGEYRSQTFFEIKRWIEDGRLTRDELDDRVRRTLKMKAAKGLFADGGKVNPAKANAVLQDPGIGKLSRDVARGCVTILRDRQKLLPVAKTSKVLVIEQILREDFVSNDMYYHAHSFNEAMLDHSLNLIPADSHFRATAQERKLLLKLADQADLVVMTNHYWRVWPENNTPLVREFLKRGKKVVVVTNNLYEFGAPKEAGTVVCTYGMGTDALKAAAAVIFGALEPRAAWPLEHSKPAK